MNTSIRGFTAFALACLALAACTPAQRSAADLDPQSTVSPKLDSGVTSNNGGGSRALGNNNNVGVTTPDSKAR